MKYKREDMLDLNEVNVKNLFKYCLATEETPKNNFVVSSFFTDDCNVNIPKIPFCYDKLEEKQLAVRYLLGQLKKVHTNRNLMSLSDGFYKYDGTNWTSDKRALFSLYYLGCATLNFPQFSPSIKPNHFDAVLTEIPTLKPTMSPNDPNFEKWCRENDIV
ncbi:MAG: hypothetical protein IJ410_04535 [Oscillospiraceae bacterium]|nr:hypothetical protein [Oscillospiraceae bacterium]